MATAAEFRTERVFWPCCSFDQKLCRVTVRASELPVRAVAACLPLKVKSLWVHHFFFSHTCPSLLVPCFTPKSPIRTQFSTFRCLMARSAVEESTYVFSLSKLSPRLPINFSSNTHFALPVTDRTPQLSDWVRGHLWRVSQSYLKFMLMFSYGITVQSGLGIDVAKTSWHEEVAVLNSSGTHAERLAGIISDLWKYGVLIFCLIFIRHIYYFYNNKMCFKL